MEIKINVDTLIAIVSGMEIGERVDISNGDGFGDGGWHTVIRLDEKLVDANRLYVADYCGGGNAAAFSENGEPEYMYDNIKSYLRQQDFDLDDIVIDVSDDHWFNLTEFMKDADDTDLTPWELHDAINFANSSGYGEEVNYWEDVNPYVIMLIWNSNIGPEKERRKNKASVQSEIDELKKRIEELEKILREGK